MEQSVAGGSDLVEKHALGEIQSALEMEVMEMKEIKELNEVNEVKELYVTQRRRAGRPR